MAQMPQVNFMTPQQLLAQRLAGTPLQPPDQPANPLLDPSVPQAAAPSSLDYGDFTAARRQKALGERLMNSAGSGPVRTGWEGVGRLSKELVGAYLQRKGSQGEEDYTKKSTKGLSDALKSGLNGGKLADYLISDGNPEHLKLGLGLITDEAQRKAAAEAKLDEPHVVSEGDKLISGRGVELGLGGPKPTRFAETPSGYANLDKLDDAGVPTIVIPKKNNHNQPFNEDGTPNKAYQDYQKQRDVDRRLASVNNPTAPQKSGLTDQAVDDGAAYFIQTGTMPVGLRNRADQTAIQNRIGELKPQGMDSTTWMKGLTNAGLSFNTRKQAAAATGKQQALTVVNENTVNGSVKILDGLLKQGAASNLPFVSANDALQWMRRQSNDPLANNLKNAVGAISNEYARVMTGQTGGAASSDSARNEASTRMLLGFKDGTMRTVAAQLQKEMNVRSDSYLKAMDQLTGGAYSGPTINKQVDIDPVKPASSDGWSVREVGKP